MWEPTKSSGSHMIPGWFPYGWLEPLHRTWLRVSGFRLFLLEATFLPGSHLLSQPGSHSVCSRSHSPFSRLLDWDI